MNVCIHDFDYAKEESNKAASKDKHCFKTKCFQDMQGSGNRLPEDKFGK